jgi:hypothetical protein
VLDKPFSIGFMGTTSNEVLFEAAEFVIGDVFMPFTGSGKDVSWLSQEGRTIYSFDTQYLSKLMVDGVFNEVIDEDEVKMVGYKPHEGYAFNNPPFKRMEPGVLREIDGLASTGDEYLRAALCRALIQGTIGGRLTHWELSLDKLQAKVRNSLVNNLTFTNLPGKRVHTFGNVFENEWPQADTMWIDPPKVVTSTDVYSKGFLGLNSVLAQEQQVLPVWRWGDVLSRLRKLWEHPCKRIIQFYCSDVRPTDDAVKAELEKCGTIKERIRIRHGSRADYIYVVDKE